MEVITVESEAFQSLKALLTEIIENSKKPMDDPTKKWLTNQEFCILLDISKRCAQNYRDQGRIPFSQPSSKVYYRLSDVQDFLESNLVGGFNSKKNNG